MAFLHSASSECLKEELSLFEIPPTQTAIESSQWVNYKPISTLSDDSPIGFSIPSSGEDYNDLAHTLLSLRVKIRNATVHWAPFTRKQGRGCRHAEKFLYSPTAEVAWIRLERVYALPHEDRPLSEALDDFVYLRVEYDQDLEERDIKSSFSKFVDPKPRVSFELSDVEARVSHGLARTADQHLLFSCALNANPGLGAKTPLNSFPLHVNPAVNKSLGDRLGITRPLYNIAAAGSFTTLCTENGNCDSATLSLFGGAMACLVIQTGNEGDVHNMAMDILSRCRPELVRAGPDAVVPPCSGPQIGSGRPAVKRIEEVHLDLGMFRHAPSPPFSVSNPQVTLHDLTEQEAGCDMIEGSPLVSGDVCVQVADVITFEDLGLAELFEVVCPRCYGAFKHEPRCGSRYECPFCLYSNFGTTPSMSSILASPCFPPSESAISEPGSPVLPPIGILPPPSDSAVSPVSESVPAWQDTSTVPRLELDHIMHDHGVFPGPASCSSGMVTIDAKDQNSGAPGSATGLSLEAPTGVCVSLVRVKIDRQHFDRVVRRAEHESSAEWPTT
ncbi:hypothetical protein QAD02_007050 [Eretmocerus hayati]|uniref:Uncharacterized protein n=1 Tax=Eretmocerus hayati TaxID=131215 RepID=A0ACC2N3U6_9HYME|nr:hypothetical protein QAD02_007050 [Eretmocerus hayati]